MEELPKSEILLIDKPAGVSSFGVVARVRRKLSEEAGYVEVRGKDGVVRQKRRKVKVGHTGTLDPFATGLLILLVGKETKRATEFLKLDKEYIATLRLGEISTTGDPEGERMVVFSGEDSTESGFCFDDGLEAGLNNPRFYGKIPERIAQEKPNKEAVEKCVESLVGENWQTVPAFSAVKIDGKRAYKLAREGKMVEMPRRKIKIYEIEVLEYEWPELTIRCRVSSGTYIRALGEDIGKMLGTGAYLTALRRTQVGVYRVEEAEKIE